MKLITAAEAKDYQRDREKPRGGEPNEKEVIEHDLRTWKDSALPPIPLERIESNGSDEAPLKGA